MTRADGVGMFWADFPTTRGERSERMVRVIEPPKTGWTPPKDFPNLKHAEVIGFDTETHDPNLIEKGPGGVRKDGEIIGLSFAVEDQAWYFPIRHQYEAERHFNLDPDKVLRWAADTLSTRALKVGANVMYDLEWLKAEGVEVNGPFYDVQFAEPLLDENAGSYALEVLGKRHVGAGKDTADLYSWCSESFGGPTSYKQAANFYRSPPSLVGPYAEWDALLPLQVRQAQQKQLEEERLTRLLDIEHRLIPLLIKMRFKGVRVDIDKAEQALKWLRVEAAKAQEMLGKVDAWAPAQLAKLCDAHEIPYQRTEHGNPSFTKEWLKTQSHPLLKAVLAVRSYEKAANPFIESYILGGHINGRVHCQFHPLRSDDYGTVSGRFSSSNPNLQNIPARDPVLAPLLRGLFIPDDGCLWHRGDYSQIEYRLLAHDAVGPGAEEIRQRYLKDPRVNYHRATMEMVAAQTEVLLEYKAAKNFNFGMVYGMGKGKILSSLDIQYELALRLYDAYHEANPYVKDTFNSAKRLANRRGFIRTLLGRRRRFPHWAENEYSQVNERVGIQKALNARLQGGAADIMKKAMVDIYEAGIYEVVGVPHLTVHDELDGDDDGSPQARQAYAEAKHIMEHCVELKVPLLVEESTGANWGECA
jgi:DNA polymerase I-like protein with 3'-5' exonuclease and polymerase domains